MPDATVPARNRLNALQRHRGPNAPEIADARRDLRAAKLRDHIRRVVDDLPPLTDAQRAELAALLTPSIPEG